MTHRKKILFFVTEDWFFCSHRLPLAVAAKKAGFEVVVATNVVNHGGPITSQGIKLIPLYFSRHSINPLRELKFIGRLVRLYKTEAPDIVHHVANKPILYGSLAAIFSKTPYTINALTGLRHNVFFSNHWKTKIYRALVSTLFKIIFNRRNSKIIFQNNDDKEFLIKEGILKSRNCVTIKGAGVNTNEFFFSEEPAGDIQVILPARMLWDKGVGEFVEAARSLKKEHPRVRFVLVGDRDPGNPAGIGPEKLQEWRDEKVVEWWGKRQDMPRVYAGSHIVCLPSYREGLPKALLEAASAGRPIVTTDTAGCREVVLEGVNGYLVPVCNVDQLAKALKRLIEDKALRKKMGTEGRKMAEQIFSIDKVIEETLNVYQEILKEIQTANLRG